MSHDHCHSHNHQSCPCCQSHQHEHSECHGHSHEDECGDFSKILLELADEAWMELLKDKIKEKILASSGKNLDQLATTVSEANKERWKSKMAAKKQCHAYKDKLHEILGNE